MQVLRRSFDVATPCDVTVDVTRPSLLVVESKFTDLRNLNRLTGRMNNQCSTRCLGSLLPESGTNRFAKFSQFDEKESVSAVQQLKSSVQKGIRSKLLESYPHLESHIDSILPKKEACKIVKCHDHIEIMVNGTGELLFFRQRDGPWMPTLRLLHKYPIFLPMQQVDKGAIRFVLSGANIMCPGLTSPGAKMSPVDKGTVVAIMAEGKQHALAIGLTKLSTEDIARINKDVGVENCHYLNDGLWQMKPIK